MASRPLTTATSARTPRTHLLQHFSQRSTGFLSQDFSKGPHLRVLASSRTPHPHSLLVPLGSLAYLCELHSCFPWHVNLTHLIPFKTKTSRSGIKYKLHRRPSEKGLRSCGMAFLLSSKKAPPDFLTASQHRPFPALLKTSTCSPQIDSACITAK